MNSAVARTIQMIPIDAIKILNPRARNKRVFSQIVTNIASIGLKRPITVAQRARPEGTHYDLVCGQGRLEAYRHLGQPEIPALIVEADSEDCLVMSLVENLARRAPRGVDLLQAISSLKERGYREPEIALKTGLTTDYVKNVINLLERGELRLLRAVESGQVPVTIAVKIAEAKDADLRGVLQQAYEAKLLSGRKLIAARRLVDQRRRQGKGLRVIEDKTGESISIEGLARHHSEKKGKKSLPDPK